MTPVPVQTPAVAGERLLDQFAAMLRIRRFEERIEKMRHAGEVIGSVHLCIGQEAIPVGARAALEQRDAVFSTYRGHGWALPAACRWRRCSASCSGSAPGVNGGRGGSAYFTAAAVRLLRRELDRRRRRADRRRRRAGGQIRRLRRGRADRLRRGRDEPGLRPRGAQLRRRLRPRRDLRDREQQVLRADADEEHGPRRRAVEARRRATRSPACGSTATTPARCARRCSKRPRGRARGRGRR